MRSHRFSRLTTLLSVIALSAAVACSSESSVGPSAAAPRLGLTAAEEAEKAAKKAAHDQLIARRDSVRNAQKQARDANKDELKAALTDWNEYKREWAQYKKENKDAQVELLRCKPLPYAADAQVIGPDGGTVKMGPHQLVIPKGALDHEELIIGDAPTSSKVEVRFGPHGLHFLQSAQLTLSYEQCMRPTDFLEQLRIVYVGDGTVEFPRSIDSKDMKKVQAPIDHFSGYMIAY